MIPESEIREARILVIGDQESDVFLIEQLLGKSGYTRVGSTRDQQAVGDRKNRQRYDLIVLDLQTTVMDRLESIETGPSSAPDDCPILALVAQAGDGLRALRAGAKDFVSKPFDLVEIQTRIHNLLEIRLLYQKLERGDQNLELTVDERTAELRANEARFRRLTELASDWYWEQDEDGVFTRVYGPVFEMLGIGSEGNTVQSVAGIDAQGWNEDERASLRASIAARRPFIDFAFTRNRGDGPPQKFLVSGEPMFDRNARFIGYRGVGIEITTEK